MTGPESESRLGPESLATVGELVAARVDALLEAEIARWSSIDESLVEPLTSLRRLVGAGGKRIRPAFCYCGFLAGAPHGAGRSGGGALSAEVLDAGSALELLHTCALIHDDIMDGSTRRRGLTCMHLEHAERHRARGWRGEPRRFGDGAAILTGDLAFVYADQFMRNASPEAIDVFNEMRLEVNVGQYLDLLATASGQATVEQARTICVYKAGKYTVERPLHLGAALAGKLDELAKPLSSYGLPLGEAFQLRDDVLGAFGDEALLGKGVGEDFREGKPTALYATALTRATGTDATLLRERFGQADLTDDEVIALQGVFIHTGARESVEATIEALMTEAVGALSDSAVSEEARTELRALALFVAGRDH